MMLLRTVFYGVMICLSWGGVLWAAEAAEPTETMPEITVVDQAVVNTPGKSVLDRNALQALPQGDGAITDLLRVLPGVQFSEADNSSLTGGEILPPEISISGGRIYDNNFMIDGLGNNSLLNPTATNVANISDVPGHSQELFIDSSLIESIVVHRSNIPARYSGFTGGVVDMDTRNPATMFGGQVALRTTRSEWTSFHVDREDQEEFAFSDSHFKQPEFRKYNGDFSLDLPINNQMGLLLSYSHSFSRIPLTLLGDSKKQYRTNENWFAKYRYQPSDKTDLTMTALWNPYEGEYFVVNTKDSDFTVEGGGLSLNTTLKQDLLFGRLELILGWRQSENSRRAPNDFYSWDRDGVSTPWGEGYSTYSQQGGYGDIDTEQETLTMAAHLELNPVEALGVEHSWATGLTFERTKAEYRRSAATSLTRWIDNSDVVCDDRDDLCLPGEQFAYWLTIYPEDDADAEITQVDFYLEDSIKLKNVTFRPGLHVGYNDLMSNTDYALRGAVFYDLFNNGATIFSAGANRYYGKTFLSYALAEERKTSQLFKRSKSLEDDNTPEVWTEKILSSEQSRLADFDTPYVDEWTLGFEQDFLGGRVSLAYIDRNTEDAFASESVIDDDGELYRELTNNGNGRHKEVTLSWERQWDCHYLLVDGAWQRSQVSNEDYADEFGFDEELEQVWYEDHLKFRTDLPRTDYNRKWSANLIYRVELDYGLSFSNITRYRSGYEGITDTKENYTLEDGTKVDIYAKRDYPSATTFDWKLEWQYPVSETQQLTLTADVYNVFNRKVYSGIEGQYQMGRQLWVGMEYAF